MKAVIVEKDLEFRHTHGIRQLVGPLKDQEIQVKICDIEMDLMPEGGPWPRELWKG